MLFGMSLIYGITGTTNSPRSRSAWPHPVLRSIAVLSVFFVVVGSASRSRRSLPVVGARHLRGVARPGGRLPLRGLEDRRVRGLLQIMFIASTASPTSGVRSLLPWRSSR